MSPWKNDMDQEVVVKHRHKWVLRRWLTKEGDRRRRWCQRREHVLDYIGRFGKDITLVRYNRRSFHRSLTFTFPYPSVNLSFLTANERTPSGLTDLVLEATKRRRRMKSQLPTQCPPFSVLSSPIYLLLDACGHLTAWRSFELLVMFSV